MVDKLITGFLTKCQCWEPECGSRALDKKDKKAQAGETDRFQNARSPSTMRLALKPAGVGIVFQREESDDHQGLVVDSLAPGGPADVSKMVDCGDRLVMINGKSIRGMDARGIARLILGPLGSKVELVFESKGTAPPERKTVTLTRGVQLSVGP